MEATETVTKKTTIRPNIANMVKTPGGSYHKDDFVGNALAGLTLDQVKNIASEIGLDPSKYEHLNNGQQRMTLGSQIRKAAAENEALITNMSDEYREGNLIAAQEAAEAKAAAKAAAKPKKAKKVKEAAEAE
jgi:hypothetical protein